MSMTHIISIEEANIFANIIPKYVRISLYTASLLTHLRIIQIEAIIDTTNIYNTITKYNILITMSI